MTSLMTLSAIRDIDTAAVAEFINLNYEKIFNGMDIMPNSKPTYISNGKDFLKYLETAIFDLDIYRSYKEYLRKREDIGTKSKSAKLTAAKMLLSDLHSRYHVLPMDVTQGVKGFKITSGHTKDGLNSSEVEKVRTYIQGITNDAKRTRLNAMFYLLAFQGLRQFEICNLEVEDVNFSDCTAMVRGKGSDDKQQIDLHPLTVKALREYSITANKKSGYFFTSEKGTSTGSKLTERGFRKIFDAIFDITEVDRTAHGFRHFFVTTLLEATNGNIGVVKQFSRHKSTAALVMYDDRKNKKSHLPMYHSTFN